MLHWYVRITYIMNQIFFSKVTDKMEQSEYHASVYIL